MSAFANLPDWLLATMTVVGFLGFLFGIAWHNTRRQISRTLARRTNPSAAQFMVLMNADVSEEASLFLWETALPYLAVQKPPLTPHPDDDLVKDLPIDSDDIALDWPRAWAEKHGLHVSNLHEWPKEWPVTIRNYGRWLDMGFSYDSSPRT